MLDNCFQLWGWHGSLSPDYPVLLPVLAGCSCSYCSNECVPNGQVLFSVLLSQHEAFLQIDCDYYAATSSTGTSAGTTALAAVVWGGHVVVANAGDSRAVIGRRGKAIQLTSDHKPLSERARIEASGGFVCADGRLCGELGVVSASPEP